MITSGELALGADGRAAGSAAGERGGKDDQHHEHGDGAAAPRHGGAAPGPAVAEEVPIIVPACVPSRSLRPTAGPRRACDVSYRPIGEWAPNRFQPCMSGAGLIEPSLRPHDWHLANFIPSSRQRTRPRSRKPFPLAEKARLRFARDGNRSIDADADREPGGESSGAYSGEPQAAAVDSTNPGRDRRAGWPDRGIRTCDSSDSRRRRGRYIATRNGLANNPVSLAHTSIPRPSGWKPSPRPLLSCPPQSL